MKRFNTTGLCVPERHYMSDISDTVAELAKMVEEGQYFTIHRGRQYGKTTTLNALSRYLSNDYFVLSLDFQAIAYDSFQSEASFTQALARTILDTAEFKHLPVPDEFLQSFQEIAEKDVSLIKMDHIFRIFLRWCKKSSKPVVLMIDEVDHAGNYQIFLDFLSALRLHYLNRETSADYKTFQSVILASVTDMKALKRKIRPDDMHKLNSPWNIAADFQKDMSLSIDGITGMLKEYQTEQGADMNPGNIAAELHNYTEGYPFLVCRLCQIIDKTLHRNWSIQGVSQAVKLLLAENNTLFDSLMEKVIEHRDLSNILQKLLFSGEQLSYSPYDIPVQEASMYGFIKEQQGMIKLSNRIFETLLYNYFLTKMEMQDTDIYNDIYNAGTEEKLALTESGAFDFAEILKKYITAFQDIYGETPESFTEEEGRKRFLLYLRPIINGTGNYYIEARTRNNRRMDIVIDYLGERYVIELKIWHGTAYHEKGEKQLLDYLDAYHLNTGYMLIYNFNQKKQSGIRHVNFGEKKIIEAVV